MYKFFVNIKTTLFSWGKKKVGKFSLFKWIEFKIGNLHTTYYKKIFEI